MLKVQASFNVKKEPASRAVERSLWTKPNKGGIQKGRKVRAARMTGNNIEEEWGARARTEGKDANNRK